MNKIVVVDDDAELSSLLCEYLQGEQFETHCLYDGQEAIEHIQTDDQYGVIVLDIMMPKLNGLDALQILRQRLNTPIIMLTGRGDDVDRIIGLEMGADDYLAKPCNPRELLARIRALLRRSTLTVQSKQKGAVVLHCQGISLDSSKREVVIDGAKAEGGKSKVLELTGAEFNTLNVLMQAAGSIVSKETLTRQVLHRELTHYDRSMEVHVSRLRKKLEASMKGTTEIIKTIRGEGYLLVKGSSDTPAKDTR